jgi:hypothetical protein
MQNAHATTFASLPDALQVTIFKLVDAETRLRCREVCKPWRNGPLKDGSAAWARLILRTDHEEANPDEDDRPLLRAAAARALGVLEVLDVRRCDVFGNALLEVVTANAATLREVHADWLSRVEYATELLNAAPLLHVLCSNVVCTPSNYRRVLHNEAPFGPLRLQKTKPELQRTVKWG